MRRVEAGPQSSTGQYKSTTDPGKSLPAGSTGQFRAVNTAAGPASSHAEYTSTTDPGKALPSGNAGQYRRVGSASGPESSHTAYTPTLDPGKSLPSGTSNAGGTCNGCGRVNNVGGRYCPNCGAEM